LPRIRRTSLRDVPPSVSLVVAIVSLIIAALSYVDARRATETSMKSFDVATQPSLALTCSFVEANLRRKPFSETMVWMAPAGSELSAMEADFSELRSKPRTLDMSGDQDAWACDLKSYSRLPLLNVALRFPLLVSDHPAADETPNYVICLNEIPAIPVDGDFKFVLVNGSTHKAMLFAPLSAMVTVPSVGRVSTNVTLVGLEDPFKEFLFRPLGVGPAEKHLKDAPIDETARLHCAREQDKRDRNFHEMQDSQDRLFSS
jgi:hypothetical protein